MTNSIVLLVLQYLGNLGNSQCGGGLLAGDRTLTEVMCRHRAAAFV